MKIRKTLVLLLLPFILQMASIFSSSCREPLIEYYSNKDFHFYSLDNSGPSPQVSGWGLHS